MELTELAPLYLSADTPLQNETRLDSFHQLSFGETTV